MSAAVVNSCPAAAPARRRYHDLDALRSLLMIWGIAVHTSTLSLSPALQQVARVSGYVRMEAFMTISGLLVGLLIDRYGAGLTVRRRLVALGVPLLVCLLLLNPVTNFLAYCFHNGPIPFRAYLGGEGDPLAEGPMYWHLHLWFLISLLVYALLSPLIARGLQATLPRCAAQIAAARPGRLFLVIAAALPLACFGSRLVFEFLIEPYLAKKLVFLVRSTLFYLPFYVLGFILFRSPRLLEAFAQIRWRHLLIAPLLVAAITLNFRELPKLVAETLRLLAESYLSVVLAATLFAVARRFFARESRWATYFSDAAYSIYLLHFLVIYVVATALRPALGDSGTLVILVMVLTFGATIALHHFLIRRVPVLRFLFNGRPLRPAASPALAPAASPAAAALQISRP